MGWTTQGVAVDFLAGARGLFLIDSFQTGSSTHPASYSVRFGVSGSPVILYVAKVSFWFWGPPIHFFNGYWSSYC